MDATTVFSIKGLALKEVKKWTELPRTCWVRKRVGEKKL
jgi:hypothetical protein